MLKELDQRGDGTSPRHPRMVREFHTEADFVPVESVREQIGGVKLAIEFHQLDIVAHDFFLTTQLGNVHVTDFAQAAPGGDRLGRREICLEAHLTFKLKSDITDFAPIATRAALTEA